MKNKQRPPNFIYFLLLIFSIAIPTPAGSRVMKFLTSTNQPRGFLRRLD
jgi:hypothetical protein